MKNKLSLSRAFALFALFGAVFLVVGVLAVSVHAQTAPPLSGIEITPDILPDGMVNVPYSETLTASTTGSGPFSWSVSGGSLPSGLSLVSSTASTIGVEAMVIGTPTTASQFNFTISAVNSTTTNSTTVVGGMQTYVMNIDPNLAAVSATTVSPTGTITTDTVVTTSSSVLEAEVTGLQTAVQDLEAELMNASSVSSSAAGSTVSIFTSCGSATFCRNLTIGDSGPDVMSLQQFLNSNGFEVASSGPGSPGNETQYFGSLTETALAGWQSANNITPAAGYFGPETRAAIEADMNSSSSETGTSAPMIPAPTSTTSY